ncbi:hypothetical protein EDB92DRAFT_1100733 [Lactarius akahatsu]|uniref:Uncharacterized protein n=1 Tax=Lactarius akahatsu TaxID=416441 RepID=A0AAD4QBT6_9AGAM|nr:hypothetical protein EDB92DRAFT_1100733 [Lactarius akahatsu]
MFLLLLLFQPVNAHLTPSLSDNYLIATRLIGVHFLYRHHHMSSEAGCRMFDQLRESYLWRYTIPWINPRAVSESNGPDATKHTAWVYSCPMSIPSSPNRSEVPNRLIHVSSVNLGDFSINCSIHAYRRLTDPRQRSSLGLNGIPTIASADFIFIDNIANLTYTQHNGECDLRPSKTWILLVGENADRVAD